MAFFVLSLYLCIPLGPIEPVDSKSENLTLLLNVLLAFDLHVSSVSRKEFISFVFCSLPINIYFVKVKVSVCYCRCPPIGTEVSSVLSSGQCSYHRLHCTSDSNSSLCYNNINISMLLQVSASRNISILCT